MKLKLFGGLLLLAGVCHGFSLGGSVARFAAISPRISFPRRNAAKVLMQSDDLSGAFSGLESLQFDSKWTDMENLNVQGAKVTKVIDISCLLSHTPPSLIGVSTLSE